MALRKIITVSEGDGDVLHKNTHPVKKFDQRLRDLMDDLVETLLDSGGAGLAAPQIGILRQAVVVLDDDETPLELINPEIVSASGEQEGWEGCLSIPGMWGWVKRPMRVKVKAQNRSGEWFELEREGITARCFCHEIAHLSGHLFDELAEGGLHTQEELERMEEA